jgi:hypothetical protein
MFKTLVVAFGILAAGPALAGDLGQQTLDGWEGTVGSGPVKDKLDELTEPSAEKTEAEKQADARLAELEAARAQKAARVVVLRYPGTQTTNETEALVRNIKVRIARPDAKFLPEVDLYQSGRREPDRSINPLDQRAMVDSAVIPVFQNAVNATLSIPWDGLPEQDWGLKANELRELSNELWFVDREELREPLFRLYAALGYAAENRNNPGPPYYELVGGMTVNYYWYLAGALAHETPELLGSISGNQDIVASIRYYKEQLDDGVFPWMNLSFEDAGQWNPEKFASNYIVYINGVARTITSSKALYEAPPGRVDVYMERTDGGHSLSDRIELDRLDEKIYGIRDTARQRMGGEFIDMLLEHPNECSPEVEGDILVYLAIYQKLHPDAEVYIAVAEGGSVNKVRLWRYKARQGTLERVQDNTGGFPVRFVALVGAGTIFSGIKKPEAPTADDPGFQPGDDVSVAQDAADDATGALTAAVEPALNLAGIPINYHFRGHYNRFMFTMGADYAASVSGGKWKGAYQTDARKSFVQGADFAPDDFDDENQDVSDLYQPRTYLTENPNCIILDAFETEEDFTGEGGSAEDFQTISDDCTAASHVTQEVLRERSWQRLVFGGFGFVLLRDAANGFGPRIWVRTGWYNVPHALDLTGHFGWAAQAPFGPDDGRVRLVGDMDFYAGAMIPIRDYSLRVFPAGDGNNKNGLPKGKSMMTFGVNLTAGTTF